MKKWIAGLGIGGVVVIPLVLIVIGALAVTMVSGLMAVFSGGLGATAGYQAKKNMQGQCLEGGGGASGTPTTASQKQYVQTVIGIAKTMKVPERGQIIAVMVMLQESGIQNYANSGENRFGYPIGAGSGQSTAWWLETAKYSLSYPHDAVGNDADSVGLFQQRPSSGWGDGNGYKASTSSDHGRKSVERLLDPRWSAQAFFGGPGGAPTRGLLDIPLWEAFPLAEVAQTVQGSAFPSAYTKWEPKARELVNENRGAPAVPLLSGDGGAKPSTPSGGGAGGTSAGVQMPMKEGTYTLSSPYGPRDAPTAGASTWHKGTDFAAPMGTPMYAVADGTVAEAGATPGFGQWVVIDHQVNGQKVSTVYGHMSASSIKVRTGQKVSKGQEIAGVGTEGYSTGPHLHFEVWLGGRLPYGVGQHTDPMVWLKGAHNVTGGGGTECANAGGSGGGSSASSGTASAVIDAAKKQIGVDYSWGGGSLTGPSVGSGEGAGINGFDCSGLVRYAVYNGTNKTLELPRTATDQWKATQKTSVKWEDMKPGDLMFWGTGDGSMYHTAIYLGDGKMLEAPKPGLKVRITDARRDNFITATRPDYGTGK